MQGKKTNNGTWTSDHIPDEVVESMASDILKAIRESASFQPEDTDC